MLKELKDFLKAAMCVTMFQLPLLCDGPRNQTFYGEVEWVDGGADGAVQWWADPDDPGVDWTDEAGDG